MTSEESYRNYLSHKWQSSLSNPFDSREMDTYCIECGIEDQGNPNEFVWIEYPLCKEAQELDPFKADWSRSCENCGEKPVVNQTGLCGPCTFGEAETANGNW